jgi:hypothetical protein
MAAGKVLHSRWATNKSQVYLTLVASLLKKAHSLETFYIRKLLCLNSPIFYNKGYILKSKKSRSKGLRFVNHI